MQAVAMSGMLLLLVIKCIVHKGLSGDLFTHSLVLPMPHNSYDDIQYVQCNGVK